MKQRSLLQRMAAAPHAVWSVLFIIAPMIFVVAYAFTDADGFFTFSNFGELSQYSGVFVRSILFALIATMICLVIAYPLAYLIARTAPKTQKILIMLIMLPMWTNFLIRTYSLMNILEDNGVLNTLLSKIGLGPIPMINPAGAVIFGMVYDFLPYMILPIYTVMSKMDVRLLEAAADLGCNPVKTALRVTFPLSISGIVSGVTMVFVPSVSTFYISQKLGGGNFDLVGDAIERQFLMDYNYHVGAAMSFVLMILIVISMAVMKRFSDEDNEEVLV